MRVHVLLSEWLTFLRVYHHLSNDGDRPPYRCLCHVEALLSLCDGRPGRHVGLSPAFRHDPFHDLFWRLMNLAWNLAYQEHQSEYLGLLCLSGRCQNLYSVRTAEANSGRTYGLHELNEGVLHLKNYMR